MKKCFLFIFLCACSSLPSSHSSQPFVYEVIPSNNAFLSTVNKVEIKFSEAINPNTLTEESFMIVEGNYSASDTDTIDSTLADEEFNLVEGSTTLSEDAKTLVWQPAQVLPNGFFTIIVTSAIQNPKHFPLTQTPGQGNQYFVSIFQIQEETSVASQSTEIQTVYQFPDSVFISEVVADPQQDWNDTTDGNEIAFDSMPGVGTIGSTDEWIELRNGGSSVNLSGWSLEMLDGTDETLIFGESDETLLFFAGGSLDYFNNEEFLIVGDLPGDLKTTVVLNLRDDTGALIDSIDVADANGSGIDDEAYQLHETGEWSLDLATPGFE